jgi:hypothetical protein
MLQKRKQRGERHPLADSRFWMENESEKMGKVAARQFRNNTHSSHTDIVSSQSEERK